MRGRNKPSVYYFIPGALWFAGMCVLFFMPGKDMPSVGWLSRIHFDKVVHFGLFFIFILLFAWGVYKVEKSVKFKKSIFISVVVFAFIFGLLVEFVQRDFIIGRSFDIWDWVADSLGVFTVLFLLRNGFRRLFSSQERSSANELS